MPSVPAVSSDYSGQVLPLLEVPLDIMNRAAEDPTSAEAASIDKLTKDLANLHAGEQAFMVLPSDVQDGNTGMKQYSLTFKGIDGMGKQYKTSDLIAQRKKEIYDKFGAGLLIMGNGTTAGAGSYALSDSKATLHYHFIQRDVDLIREVINNDLIPQLCAMNNILLTDIEMPKLVPKQVSGEDVDVNSKMIQRVLSVGGIPLTPAVQNEMLRMCGFNYRIPDEIAQDEVAFKTFSDKYTVSATSRAGDGMAVGKTGNGTSDVVSQQDDAANNSENAA